MVRCFLHTLPMKLFYYQLRFSPPSLIRKRLSLNIFEILLINNYIMSLVNNNTGRTKHKLQLLASIIYKLYTAQLRNKQAVLQYQRTRYSPNHLLKHKIHLECLHHKNSIMISHVETFHGTQQQPQHIAHCSSQHFSLSYTHETSMHAHIHTQVHRSTHVMHMHTPSTWVVPLQTQKQSAHHQQHKR